ncbi:MAG: carboxypeptidase regulatory-like domain-containing protein [Planctomycetes bacterium]|nr:carboxypeptidase regulatory-like domain-containing protein [Planctomycetota bacterium]
MQSRRTLIFVLLFALLTTGLIGLWKLLDTKTTTTAPVEKTATESTSSSPTKNELATPVNEPAPAPVAEARTEAAPIAAGTEQNFDLTNAREVAGRVNVPSGAPADETLRVWVVDQHGSESTGRFSFGDADDPGSLVVALETKPGVRWARRLVAADGTFRVPAPADSTVVQVVLDGRYLHTAEAVRVNLAESKDPLVLEAELGAWLVGRCTTPPTARPEDLTAGASARVTGFSMGGRRGGRGVRREVPVAADWSFEMRGLPVLSRYGLTVQPERLATFTNTKLELGAGRRTDVTCELTLGARISGRVVDDASNPIEFATIGLERAKEEKRNFRDMAMLFGGAEPRSTTTDAEGRFTLYGVDAGVWRVTAAREGYLTGESADTTLVEGGVVTDLELRLGSGATIAGVVTYADGRPAPGAGIVVLRVEKKADGGNRPFRFGPTSGEARSTASGAEGRFRVSGLEGGPFEVRATLAEAFPVDPNAPAAEEDDEHEAEVASTGTSRTRRAFRRFGGSADTNRILAPGERAGSIIRIARLEGVEANTQDAKLVLEEPPGLHGRVVDGSGAPITRFSISLEPDWEGDAPLDSSLHAQGFESADGRFFLEGVAAGNWSVHAFAENSVQTGETPVVVLPAKDELVIALQRAARIAGVVLDPLGAPVPKANVQRRAQGDTNPFAGLGMDDTDCDEKGAFVVEDLAPGSYDFIASAEGWAKSEPVALTIAGGEQKEGVVITLRRGGTLEGEVYDARGERAGGRNVQLFTMSGDMRQSAVDSDGRFREEHLTPGTYQVMLEPDLDKLGDMIDQAGEEPNPADFMAQMKMTSAEIKEGEVTRVVLGAPPKAPVRVHGKISRAGTPVTKGSVMVLNEGGALMQNMKFGKVTGEGRYEVTLDQPGDIVLVVSKDLGRQDGVEFYLSVPEVAEYERDLELPTCGLRGTVRGPDGKPLASVRVEISRTDGPTSLMVFGDGNSRTTDEGGRYAFEDLNPGVYTVAAGGEGTAPFGFGDRSSFGRAVRGGLRIEGDKVLDGIDLKLEQPGAITGIVRDSQGNAVSGATIYARTKDGELVHRFGVVSSDASGKYTYKGLAAGTYTLSARTKTLAAKDGAAVALREGESATCDLVVETGTILRVTITDKDDKPVRATLSIQDERGNEVSGMIAMDAMMDLMSKGISSTERTFGPLAPGKYVVSATTTDGKKVKKPVTLSGQDERKLRLRPD